MLNRLFIVIGTLAILALAGAFVVPRFIPWNNYRDRMEALAGEALGTPVRIVGDIQFQLLPQPQLRFADVAVGDPGAPTLSVANVEAEFSLLDFLRDHYSITRLLLDRPSLVVGVGLDGTLTTGIAPAGQVAASNVSIENATISGGTLSIADARSGVVRAEAIAGEVKLSSLGGPLSFQGSGMLGGTSYDLRFTTTAIGADGKTKLSLFAQPEDQTSSLSAEGTLALGAKPQFAGELALRRKPPAQREDVVQGDLVVTSTVEAGPERVLLSSYTIVPDENRAGTRLTGAARLTLGSAPKFDAVISGGVLALPPRDATTEEAVVPYELVRLLAELPAPPVVGIAGTVGVDIAELNLRALSLRKVRFDAVSGTAGWTLRNFSALLPGNGTVKLEGAVSAEGGRPHFSGTIALDTARLDALALLWRKPQPQNPLFNVAAALKAGLVLDDHSLTLSGGKFVLDGNAHDIGATIEFGSTRRIDVTAGFAALSPAESDIVAALLPDLSAGGSFGVTFPRGSVGLTARRATVFGLAGQGLAASGDWEGGVLELKALSAEDLGGAQFTLKLTAFGTLARPELYGEGNVKLAAFQSAALERLFETLGTPEPARAFLRRSLPAELALRLDAPGGDGSQVLALAGHAGVGELTAEAKLSAGLFRAPGSPVGLKLDLVSPDVPGLTAQLGLGDLAVLPPEGPMHLAIVAQSTPKDRVETSLTLDSGSDTLAFAGHLTTTDPARWTGSGTLKASLSDPGALAGELGAGGIAVPAVSGSAQFEFAGADNFKLSDIEAQSGGQKVSGTLGLASQGGTRTVSGALTLGAVPVQAIVATLAGPAALISSGAEIWPDGPIATGDAPRTTKGRVHVGAAAVTAGDTRLLGNVEFDLDWDADTLRLRQLKGTIGEGTLTLDASLCCAGPTAEKTVTARVGIDSADIAALLPSGAATGLGGTVSGGAQFQGTGATLRDVVASLAGDGNFLARDLRVSGLDSAAFANIAGLDNILDLQPDQLSTLIQQALEKGPFTAPEVGGSFTVAGGTLRSPNLAVAGPQVRLFGGTNIQLANLALDGAYTLSPIGSLGEGGFINDTTAQVTARIGGTLSAPQRTFDVESMVDAIQVHAYEMELAELERLRAEDEARVKAAADERARAEAAAKAARDAANTKSAVDAALAVVVTTQQSAPAEIKAVGETARKAAEAEAASIAATEAAAQKAADAARKAAAEQALRQATPPRPAVQTPVPAPAAPLPPLVLTPIEPGSRF